METIPVAETTELDSDFSPLSPRPAQDSLESAKPTITATDTSVINPALRAAVEKYPTTTEMIVHEGGTIWFKYAKRTQKIAQMFNVTGTPVGRPITYDEMSNFLAVHVMGARTQEQAETNWARVQESVKKKGTFSESIRLGWGAKARVQLFRQGKGRLAIGVRVSRSIPPPLDQMGLPQQVIPLLRSAQRGLILLTGPMSSGKTTTAQSIINHHNITRSGHIVTIEDPIETDLRPGTCLISAKEVGFDCTSFHQGLIDALRQAADVLLIGELRDAETIRVALAAAASGILVIATTHGDTCTGTLSKLMTLLGNEAPGYFKILSQNLVCVIRQAMLPNVAGDRWVGVADALMPNEGGGIATLIGEGKISQLEQTIYSGGHGGAQPKTVEWVSMNERLLQLVRSGEVSMSVARQTSSFPKGLTF